MWLELVVMGDCGHMGLPPPVSFADVGCHHPYLPDTDLQSLGTVLTHPDVLIVAVPCEVYRDLSADGHQIVDIWASLGNSIRL